MKARIRTSLVIAGIAIAMVAASQSIGPAAYDLRMLEKHAMPCYSEDEVHYLMNSNQWPRQKAVDVLELSCQTFDRLE